MMILRPYTNKDFQLLNQYFPAVEIGKYTNKGRYKFLSLLGFYKSHFMVLIDNEQLIGCGVLRHKWSREVRNKGWWFYAIWINPIYRGKGYGFFLMQELLSEVKMKKIKQVGLTVDEDNKIARNLYKKIGFVEIGKNKQQIIMQYDL